MLPWLRDEFANASAHYAAGRRARKALDQARCQVAQLIGADAGEIFFTSGGTESVNTALHSLNRLTSNGSAIVSAIEHSAVLRSVEAFVRPHQLLAVDSNGCLDIEAYKYIISKGAFVSLMLANNETGVLQPVQEACELAHANGLPFHTDAIQAAGKIPCDVRTLGVDMLSLSSHKFHGPKGSGALYVRNGLRFSPMLMGGDQENGRRSGTENIASIVGMGAAAAAMKKALEQGAKEKLQELRDIFERIITKEIPYVKINGNSAARLPNTSHISLENCDAAGMLILLDEAGVACSAGSACMTGQQKPSHVQLAMGIPEATAKTSLRFSFSQMNTKSEIHHLADIIKLSSEKLRKVQGGNVGPVLVYSA